MRQLKAISQNLMHANISITDRIYEGLSDKDIKKQITSLIRIPLQDNKDLLFDLLNRNKDLIEIIEKKIM
jgi:hypothetical protein